MRANLRIVMWGATFAAALVLGCVGQLDQDREAREGALYFPLPPNPCDVTLCPAGTHCEVENVQCFAEPCPPVVACVPDRPPVPDSPRCGPGPVCDVYCELGYVLDDKGCVTCACNPPPKPDDPCATVRCADGFHCEVENVQCFVAPCPPVVTCVPDKPPVVDPPVCEATCQLYCEFGNVLDENGCPICRCNPPPVGVDR